MYLDVVDPKARPLYISRRRVDRIFKRRRFSRQVNGNVAIATHNRSVIAPGFEECIALIVRYIGHVGQYNCEVVTFHGSIHFKYLLMWATINPVANLASVVLRNPRRRVYADNATTAMARRTIQLSPNVCLPAGFDDSPAELFRVLDRFSDVLVGMLQHRQTHKFAALF